ncbi:MAG: hypothetical protein IK022_00905 [Bacteroidales bacterium]|nr:hypothetical protein [Bacteroidales bacterium]
MKRLEEVQASTEKSRKNDRSRASIPEGIKTSVRTAKEYRDIYKEEFDPGSG